MKDQMVKIKAITTITKAIQKIQKESDGPIFLDENSITNTDTVIDKLCDILEELGIDEEEIEDLLDM